MNFKRIGRMIICLLMVCALLVNVSPIRAEASAGALLGSIAGVTSVNVPAGLVYGAAAIALGVMAGTNDDFVDLVDYAVDTATDWVKDGTIELLRVVDATGKAAYYAAGDFLEALRKKLFDAEIVLPSASTTISYSFSPYETSYRTYSCTQPVKMVAFLEPLDGSYGFPNPHSIMMYAIGTQPFRVNDLNKGSYYDERGFHYVSMGSSVVDPAKLLGFSEIIYETFAGYTGDFGGDYISSYDLNIGHVSSVPIDGSSALDWSEEYASKRIYVTGGSNDPDPPDENNGKWFWPLALTLTAADLYLMSQADEWSGETPQEFDQYTQNTEFEILDRPEFDGYQAIEIAPVTNPNPNPNPDVGEDPDVNPDVNTDYRTWFSKLYTVVENIQGKLEEIPNRFQSWITDCKTAIEELPSKFGMWLDSILEWLQKIWEGIISIPELLLSGIKALFIPSEDFLTSKVEAIRAEYAFADSIIATGEFIGASLTGLETSPPIIYIHLEDTEGPYDIGGTVPFIDMRWYERYKPTVDALLSALLWIIFCWRIFLKLPGIISGMPGDFVMDGLNHLGGADHLPSRKAGYEVQRMANREQIRRGNK